uniref:Uncharacterized protein n=1 Tax=Leersia perrieri TaxID=77586 RepID=A0A0D9VHZ3_9ORYZ
MDKKKHTHRRSTQYAPSRSPSCAPPRASTAPSIHPTNPLPGRRRRPAARIPCAPVGRRLRPASPRICDAPPPRASLFPELFTPATITLPRFGPSSSSGLCAPLALIRFKFNSPSALIRVNLTFVSTNSPNRGCLPLLDRKEEPTNCCFYKAN